MDQLRLPLIPDAPANVQVSMQADEPPEYRPSVSGDRPCWRFWERTGYAVFIEGVGKAILRTWVGEQERTRALHRVGGGAYWPLNWGDYVGLSRLRIEVGGRTVLNLPVEVRSRKLGYEEDYRYLLDELADWLAALAFSVSTPTTLPTVVAAPERGSLYLAYLLIRHLMQRHRLPAAFERVRMEPHRRLVREPRRVDFAQAQQIGARALTDLVASADLARGGGVLSPAVARLLRGYVPIHLTDTRPRTDFDTPENRFVAHLLRTMGQRLGRLERAFRHDATKHPARADLARSLVADCRRWARQTAEMERAAFLEGVGPMVVFPAASQVLRRREGYRQLRDAYLRLLLSPRVRWEGLEERLEAPSRDVPTLYEYWCFFALADALARATGTSPDWRSLVWKTDVWEVRLRQGQKARLPIGPATLWYNRGFGHPNSYSLPLRPDYTIEVRGRRWLLDAKYRLEWEELEAALKEGEESEERDRGTTFKQADLYKMHTYRDAIRGAEAVFILYPGAQFRAFGADGQRYDDPAGLPPGFAGVGAVPLRPGRTAALEAVVQAMVQQ